LTVISLNQREKITHSGGSGCGGAAVVAAVVLADIHDCLYVCIDDGGDGGDGGYTRWLLDCWMTNLQIEICLKGYPATVCCADELPSHAGVRHRTFIVNADTCDRGGSHWVAFHFPLVEPTEFFDSLGNAPETYHRRFANVNGPQ
jgi:hypothetical protein